MTFDAHLPAALCAVLYSMIAPAPMAAQAAVRMEVVSEDVAVIYDSRVAEVTMTAIATGQGLILVDALSSPAAGRTARELITRWSDEPVRILIQTHAHGDHVWGSQAFPEARRMASRATARDIPRDLESWRDQQIHRLVALDRRIEAAEDAAEAARLEAAREAVAADIEIMNRVSMTETVPDEVVTEDREFTLGRHRVHLILFHNGHTAGDLAVRVPGADLLVTGDLIFGGQLPFIDGTAAGALVPLIEIHDRLLGLTGPKTAVVTGHREVGGSALIRDRLDYLRDLRDGIARAEAAGWTLERARRELTLTKHRHLARFDDFHSANLETAWREAQLDLLSVAEEYRLSASK